MGLAAFNNCTGLTGTLDLYALSLTVINSTTFRNCISLTSLILPSSLESISNQSFQLCVGLTGPLDLALTNLQIIGGGAFQNCSSLGSLTLPSSLTFIGDNAFQNCSSLTGPLDLSLTNLQTIGNAAFQNCRQLDSLTLPTSLTTLGGLSFNGCSGFTDIYFKIGCTLQTNSFSLAPNATVYAYNGNSFTVVTAGTFSPIANPLSTFFSKWRLYDYPYPNQTSYYQQGESSFTLNYHEVVTSTFYTYSPISKYDYVIEIDGDDVTIDFTQTYDPVNNRTTFSGVIPPLSHEMYIDDNGPMYLNDTLAIIQNSEEVIEVDVNVPFTIEPDHAPYTLYYDGTSGLLPPLSQPQQFNQFEFTIFENNVQIKGGDVSSLDLTLLPYFKSSKMYYGSIIYTLEYPDPPVTVKVQLVDANTGLPMSEPEDATGSYYVNNLPEGRYYLRIVNENLIYDHTIISNICFIEGTIVKTDQGFISIDKITNQTLNHKPITVTKTIHADPYLVKVSAGAFGELPTRDTYMSLKHHIMLEKPIMAKNLINGDTITEVPYDGEYLYNVLVDTHTTMRVHGMLVETLDPNSIVGLFYRANLSPKQKNKMIRMINEEPERAMRMLKVS